MAFLPLFSGKAYPRGKYYEEITLMEYIDNYENRKRDARKYCYIIKCSDLQKIFTNADITLKKFKRNKKSFWNRRHPVEGKEYGVEICNDDNGKQDTYISSGYLVYRKQWMHGNAEAQSSIYASEITPDEVIKLDEQLRNYDISRNANDVYHAR